MTIAYNPQNYQQMLESGVWSTKPNTPDAPVRSLMELPVWCMAGDYRPSFPFVCYVEPTLKGAPRLSYKGWGTRTSD